VINVVLERLGTILRLEHGVNPIRIKPSFRATAIIATAFGASISAVDSDGFTEACSWGACNAGYPGAGDNPKDFVGKMFDGRYIYFVPNTDVACNGEVLRYDTAGRFRPLSRAISACPVAPEEQRHPAGPEPSGLHRGCRHPHTFRPGSALSTGR